MIAVPLAKLLELSYLIKPLRDPKIAMYDELIDRYGGDVQLFTRDIWINVLFSWSLAMVTFISFKLTKKYLVWHKIASWVVPLCGLAMLGPMPTYTLSDTFVLLIPQNVIFFSTVHMYLLSNTRYFTLLLAMIAYNFYSISNIVSSENWAENQPNLTPYVCIYLSSSYFGQKKVNDSRVQSFMYSCLNEIIGEEYQNIIQIFPEGLLLVK